MKALEKLVKENYDGICDGFASLVVGKVKCQGGRKWEMVVGYPFDDEVERKESEDLLRKILADDPKALNIKSSELVNYGIYVYGGVDFDIKEFAGLLEKAYEANAPVENADNDSSFEILQKLYPAAPKPDSALLTPPAPQEPPVNLKWRLFGKECFKYEDKNVTCHLQKAGRAFLLTLLVKEFDDIFYVPFKTCREGKEYTSNFIKSFV